jgi:hypothetical protein
LLVTGDNFFEVFAEIFIERDGRVAPLRLAQDFDDGPTGAMGRTDHRYGPVIFRSTFAGTARTSRASSASLIRTVVITLDHSVFSASSLPSPFVGPLTSVRRQHFDELNSPWGFSRRGR